MTRPHLRPVVLLGALLAAAGAMARGAAAEPVSAAARARAETAFVDGRLDDLDAALGAGTTLADAEPLALRDLWWRPRAGYVAPLPAADDLSLAARRLRWLADPAARGEAPYPAPQAGETDPYPRLALLVADRLQREARGAEGLPRASPLWDAPDEDVQYVWRWYASRAYEGPQPDASSPKDRAATEAAQARFEAVVERNRAWAVGAVGALILAAGLAYRRLGSRPGRKSPARPTDS